MLGFFIAKILCAFIRIIRIILILGKLNSQCDKAIRMKNLLY